VLAAHPIVIEGLESQSGQSAAQRGGRWLRHTTDCGMVQGGAERLVSGLGWAVIVSSPF
jgi:hypothetical protein